MVSGFIFCGTNSFSKEEEDYEIHTNSSPTKSRSSKSNSNNKNPYSSRGLDKFSALLAEIHEKKQQVYSRVDDPNEISLLRFVYSGDNDFKPIVVKIKPRRSFDHLVKQPKSYIEEEPKKFRKLHSSPSLNVKEEKKSEIKEGNIKKMDYYFCKKLRICQWKESQFYLVVIAILIMAFIVLFGRSFAIMCTSIGWYVLPTITKFANSSRVSSQNKNNALRRLSVKKAINSEGTKSFKTSKE